jgi:predicted lipid-binding transport protein (Tim44 family)
MKSLILALSFAVLAAGFAPMTTEAKRIGGGSSSGMQRSLPARTPSPVTPAQPAQAVPTAPAVPGAAPATAAPKRSWLGPIAGLAAGLGIAALMSHFGMGAAMGNIVMLLLLAVVAFAVLRFVMARFSRGMPSMATPNGASARGPVWDVLPAALPAPVQMAFAAPAAALPLGFDAPAFEHIAKLIFIRMQAANDSADLNDLRTFTTPEMFAGVKLDLQERGSAPQTTDVVRIDAEVLDVETEAERQIVSVRFHGLIREEADGAAAPFDEVWNLVKPADGSREWAIAGIQQGAAV